jgi:phage-related protein
MEIEFHEKVQEFIECQPLKVQTEIIFNSNIYRIFICHKKYNLHLIHGFCKKSQKTPLKEINIALKRAKETK